MTTPTRAWLWILALLSVTCLVVGFTGIISAIAENGGCEVGAFTPDRETFQSCSALNPTLVWGAVLAVIGLLLSGLTAATATVAAAIAGSKAAASEK